MRLGPSFAMLFLNRREVASPVPTEEQIREALMVVKDPELDHNIVDLGLVYNIEVDGGTVHVEMTLTSMGCPVAPEIVRQATEAVKSVPGVEHAEVKLVWNPPWRPEMMSEELRWIFGR